jgi:hypothetical protein
MKNSIKQDYVAFLNNPSISDLQDIGKFVTSSTGVPFFSDIVLFAANINGEDPENSTLFYNDEMTDILENNIKSVRNLQDLGIKVQISYLGNHQNAGWSATMTESACNSLAEKMVDDIIRFGLDGISIDEEYSLQTGNAQSFYWILKAIYNNIKFTEKKLTKALWSDQTYFSGETNVASLLTEGYEMTYAGDVSLLDKYVQYGMNKSSLFLGLSPQFNLSSSVRNICESVINNSYAGVMVWAPNAFLSTVQAEEYYSEILKAKDGDDAKVIYKS